MAGTGRARGSGGGGAADMAIQIDTGILSSAAGATMFAVAAVLKYKTGRHDSAEKQSAALLERYRTEWDRAQDRADEEADARQAAELRAATAEAKIAQLERRVAELEGQATPIRRPRGNTGSTS